MIVLVLILGLVPTIAAASGPNKIGINIVLNQTVNDNILKDLSAYGKVRDVLPQINAVMLFGAYSNLDAIKALPFVGDAAPDSESYMHGRSDRFRRWLEHLGPGCHQRN